MIKTGTLVILLLASLDLSAAPATYHAQDRYSASNHSRTASTHWNIFPHQISQQPYPAPPRHRGKYVYPQRSQIAVITPQVQVYIKPQQQQYSRQTEEVYLPYGGTYTKTTEIIPNDRYQPSYQIQSGIEVISQGHYAVEE